MNNTGLDDLGLIYMNARYYVPEVGRFISPDTIVPDPGNSQSFNRYSYGYNNPVKYTDPSGHYAQCSATGSDGFYASCDQWMLEAIRILGLEGGLDGARLAELFWQWFNDPGKMLNIKAYYVQPDWMYTRQLTVDTASIFIDMNVVTGLDRGDIALVGHELEHVSQGTWQAWSIQGEVLAYQVKYRIREAMGAVLGQDIQTPNTRGAMGQLDPPRSPFDSGSYSDLQEARSGFLGPGKPYNVWIEPNLPWGQELGRAYSAGQKEMARSLIVDSSWLTTTIDRWIP
jgi:RHS repeat-associated protein